MCSRSSAHDREAPGPEGFEVKRGEYKKMGLYDFVRRDIERFFAHPVNLLRICNTYNHKGGSHSFTRALQIQRLEAATGICEKRLG